MPTQVENSELIDLLRPYFWHKSDTLPAAPASSVLVPVPSLYEMLPYVRCIWPMGLTRYVVAAPNYWTYVQDIAAGFDLVMNGAVPPASAFGGIANLIPPYVRFNGTNAYLSHAADAQFRNGQGGPGYVDIGLLMGGWWRFQDWPGAGTEEAMISVWSAVDADKLYMLSVNDAHNIVFRVAHNFGGTFAVETVTSSGVVPDDSGWHFIMGRWSSSSNRLYTLIDTDWTSHVIVQYPFYGANQVSTAPFQISGYNGANWLVGRAFASMILLCGGDPGQDRVEWLYEQSSGWYQ